MQTSRKTRVPALALAAVILLGGAAFGVSSYMQYKQIQYINGIISRLPRSWDVRVGECGGSFFGDVVTLKKVSLRLPAPDGSENGAPLDVTMDAVAVKGVNSKAEASQGGSRMVDRVAVGGLAWAGVGVAGSVEQLSVTGLRGDVPELARQIRAGRHRFDPARERLALLDFAVDKAAARNARFTRAGGRSPVTVTAAAAEAADFSILKSGPLHAVDITVERDGRLFASAGRAGVDGWALPGTGAMPDAKKNYALGENPLDGDVSIDGLRIEDARLEIPQPDGGTLPLIIGSHRLSARFTDQGQSFSGATSGLVVGKKPLSILAGPVLDDVLPFLPETLHANAELSVAIAPAESGMAEISVRPLAVDIAGLGSLNASLVMEKNPEPLSGEAALRSFEATVTDEGLSELVFARLGKNQGKTADEGCRDALLMLGISGVAIQGAVRELNANILSFLEKPGATLSVKLDPGEAVDLETLGFTLLTKPDSSGLSFSVSRPGQ